MSAPTPARGRAAVLAVAVARLVRYPATQARLPQAMWISSHAAGVACAVAVASLPGWGFIGSRDVFYVAALSTLAAVFASSVCHYLDRRPGPRWWRVVSRLVHGVVAPVGVFSAGVALVAQWTWTPEPQVAKGLVVAAFWVLLAWSTVDLWRARVVWRRGRR